MTDKIKTSSPIFAIMLVIILAGIACVAASPFYTLYEIKKAIRAGDADKLSTFIDFPSVRENFKTSVDGAAGRQLKNNPELKDNPIARLGLMVGAAVADTAIDALVSPRGVATLLIVNSPADPSSTSAGDDQAAKIEHDKPKSQLGYDYKYESFNQFGARIKNKSTGELGPYITLTRSGLFDWKVTKISL
jgi:hypothetical protein